MTRFDQEMQLFEEIKNKYTPIAGYHLVLDLGAYKNGEIIILKFEFESDEYQKLVNIEIREKNKEIVIVTSNGSNVLEYDSHDLFLVYNYDKNTVIEFFDKSPNPYKLNRSLKHQMELLVYDLTHPKPKKPAC